MRIHQQGKVKIGGSEIAQEGKTCVRQDRVRAKKNASASTGLSQGGKSVRTGAGRLEGKTTVKGENPKKGLCIRGDSERRDGKIRENSAAKPAN